MRENAKKLILKPRAFGENMKEIHLTDKWVIYAGDVNQDGLVDAEDVLSIRNLGLAFGKGYEDEDVNGDGCIDADDLIIVDNNAAKFVEKITP